MDFILDHLAIGSAQDAWERPADVDAMLCVAEEIDLPPGIAVSHKVPVRDMQPIPPAQLGEALDWIDRYVSDRRILVFCNAGVGRSTSTVVGYLCCRRGYGFGEAVEFVARRRPYMSILPNLLPTIEEVQRRGGRSDAIGSE
jgi:protein-tyrosine phosphatase